MLIRRHPDWLKVHIPGGKNYKKIKSLIFSASTHTVCEEAKCPNLAECWARGTATFLILGDKCTRSCRFCNIKTGKPNIADKNEPIKIARVVKALKLKYVVITSVNRDDIKDGGASYFAQTIKLIKKTAPLCKIEILTPDFKGDRKAVLTVLKAKPDVFSHNIETVKRLFPIVRPQGNYRLSLNVLKTVKSFNYKTKSSMMVGLGETSDEIIQAMKDLRSSGCDIFMIGQYLQPTKTHLPIKKYYTPKEFTALKHTAYSLGFKFVASGPLIRSSYMADRAVLA